MRESAHRPICKPRARHGSVGTGRQISSSILNASIYPSTVTITASVGASTVSIVSTTITAAATTIAPTVAAGVSISASVVTAAASVTATTAISGTTPLMLSALAWWDGNDPEADGSAPSDGTSPSAWNDRTANAHHLTTKSGGATSESNELNGLSIMRFDGVDDGYSNSSPFMFANGTIEIWALVKSDESGTGSVINECHSTQNGQAYRVTDDDTNNDFGWNFDNASNTTRFNNTQDRRTNTWDLVVVTDLGASGGTNNEVVGVDNGTTGAYTRDATTFNRLAVGYLPRATPAQFFDGDIAEIIVFSAQLNATQHGQMLNYIDWKWGQSFHNVSISASTVTASASVPFTGAGMSAAILALSPLGYWKLDEGSGTTAIDVSGNARDGTYSGTVTLQTWSGPGNDSYADFGGGRVTIADNNVWSANNASGITIVMLIRPESADLSGTTRKIFISKGNTSNFEWQYVINSQSNSGRLHAEMYNSSGSDISNEYKDSALTADVWNFVALATASPTFDLRFDIYANGGSPLASSKITNTNSTYSNGTAAVNIGYRVDNPASQSWNGGIAHVAIFAGKLNSTQIGSIYTAADVDGWV